MDAIGFAVVAWLIADFGSGVVHWLEDRYGDPDWIWPIGEHVVRPNIEHHQRPSLLTRSRYLERNATSILAAAPFIIAAAWFECWAIACGLAWLSQGNEVHSWAHQKCSRPIRALQAVGILQSPRAHALHHRTPFDSNFCACTDWLNPILQAVGFWRRLERVVELTTGIKPRPERSAA